MERRSIRIQSHATTTNDAKQTARLTKPIPNTMTARQKICAYWHRLGRAQMDSFNGFLLNDDDVSRAWSELICFDEFWRESLFVVTSLSSKHNSKRRLVCGSDLRDRRLSWLRSAVASIFDETIPAWFPLRIESSQPTARFLVLCMISSIMTLGTT